MKWIARNLTVVLLGAVTSVLTAAFLLLLEARGGDALFGLTLATYVPAGAIAAGFVGALGYLAGSLLLRVRPSILALPIFVLVAAGTVYMVQSAEIEIMMAGKGLATDPASFGKFLANSVVHSPLQFGSVSKSDEPQTASINAQPTGAPAGGPPALAHLANDSNANVQGLAGGLQNMASAADPSKIAAQSKSLNQINKIADGIGAVGDSVVVNSDRLQMLGIQTAGFLIGAVMVFAFVRSFLYCEDCGLFLSKKAVRTRYFTREHEISSAVETFRELAKREGLQESIQEHLEKGSSEKKDFSEFSSTIEVRRCAGCEKHKVDFTARRKTKGSWKDIPLFGYVGSTSEPIQVG